MVGSQFIADTSGVWNDEPQNAVYRYGYGNNAWLGEFGRGFTDDDDNITSINAIQHGLVWACVNVIAGDLGQIPLNVTKSTKDGSEVVEDHPIHYLLNTRPNKYQTPAAFIEFLTAQMLIWGNSFAEIVRNGMGKVTELLPIPSQYMNYGVGEDGEPYYYATFPGAELIKPFELNDLIHFSQLQSNGFWGYRLVEIAFPELRLTRSNLRHASTSYANGAVPSGLLQHPGKLPSDAREELRKMWHDTHGGSKNRGKVAVLWEGVTYNAVAATAQDAQLMESIQHNPRLVGSLFQLAPYKLGDWSQSSTRANLEDSQKEYYQSTLSRRLNTLVQEINYKLFGSTKFKIKPDPTELLKGDKLTQMQTAQIAMASTIWTRNEARTYVGMNLVEGGDEFVNPNTTANAGQESSDTESEPDSQDVANRMRALVLSQCKVVATIERNRIASREKTKHPTANIKAHYRRDFEVYAKDTLQPIMETADGFIPLVDLAKALPRYADAAITRAQNVAAADWSIEENAALLASLILGESIEDN